MRFMRYYESVIGSLLIITGRIQHVAHDPHDGKVRTAMGFDMSIVWIKSI